MKTIKDNSELIGEWIYNVNNPFSESMIVVDENKELWFKCDEKSFIKKVNDSKFKGATHHLTKDGDIVNI
jgi:hypothetical protein